MQLLSEMGWGALTRARTRLLVVESASMSAHRDVLHLVAQGLGRAELHEPDRTFLGRLRVDCFQDMFGALKTEC